MQYWLTMRIKDEIPTDKVFDQFRKHASEHLAGMATAEAFLARLRADADTFRDFAQLDPRSAQGSFYTRVVEALELGAFIPLLLWIITARTQRHQHRPTERSLPSRAGRCGGLCCAAP
ncbi:MAG: hypothetical protein R2735_10590 [Microthrixaceae bacterium]